MPTFSSIFGMRSRNVASVFAQSTGRAVLGVGTSTYSVECPSVLPCTGPSLPGCTRRRAGRPRPVRSSSASLSVRRALSDR